MTDCSISQNEVFEYTYSAKNQEEIEMIRQKYMNLGENKMEKKNFVALVLGVVGGLMFSLGMCMCLLPEWNMFNTGVVLAAIGFVVLLVTVIVYRKMSGAAPIKINWKVFAKVAYGVLSALVLGTGMSMIMVFEGKMITGIIVGIVGIVMLLFLIPMCLGLKDSKKN